MNTAAAKPAARPLCAHFSSGPCAKRPGWSLDKLQGAILGRSHRAKEGKAALKEAIELTRTVLEVPKDFLIGIMPASDTGAFEAALWTLLGAPVPDGAMRPRGVDVLAWESFGKGWVTDIVKQLKLKDVRTIEAPYGALPDLRQVDFSRDVVFTWNGTTSGVRVPNGDWIAADREGLTLVDATSAAFAQRLDWPKIDALTFSWQKVLGGEAQHGMLILSPRAIARLESYKPSWPLPKLFRMTKADASGATKVDRGIFDGETINTPSMLCVEDYLDALRWAKSVGGLSGLIERADANAKTLLDWVERTPWIANLATVPATRSNTSVCLTIVDPAVTKLDKAAQADFAKRIASRLDKEGVAKDIGAYRDAPAGLRIWTGSTIEQADVAALLPWLEWAFQSELRSLSE